MADKCKEWQGLTEMDDEGWPGSFCPWHPLSSFRPLKIFDSQALIEFVYCCQPLSALVSHFWSLSILTTLCQFLQDLVSPRQPWSEILSSGEPLLSSVISGHQILVSGSTFQFQSLKIWISLSNLLIIFLPYINPGEYMRGDTEQNFVRGGSAPRSNPLTFYRLFLAEMVPLSYTFSWQMVSLSQTCLEGGILFNCCKCAAKIS